MPAFIIIAGLFCNRTVEDGRKTLMRVGYFLFLFLFLKVFFLFLNWLFYRRVEFDLLRTDGLPWFMMVMAWFFGITYLVRRIPWPLVLGLSLALACLAGYFDRVDGFLCLSRTIVYYPFFYLGYLLDAGEILNKTKRWPVMLAGAIIILGFAWLCIFRLDLVWQVKPLFSGKNPFSALPVPAMGGWLRLLYYLPVVLFIFSLIALTPDRELPITGSGQRTLQVYCLHFIAIYTLRVTEAFLWLAENLPLVWREIAFNLVALCITIFFSLPFWTMPLSSLKQLIMKRRVKPAMRTVR